MGDIAAIINVPVPFNRHGCRQSAIQAEETFETAFERQTFTNNNAQTLWIHQNSQPMLAADRLVEKDLETGMCNVFGACFAAGTKLLTPAGPRPIEDFRIGNELISRSEFDDEGALAVKVVEEVFRRTATILHVHAHGQIIRTTAEHPFFEKAKGWMKARELKPSDFLLSHDGQWVAVEEVYDTGEWETVYNLRVSDFHTYFVSGEDWGFSVWAHNTYYQQVQADQVGSQTPEVHAVITSAARRREQREENIQHNRPAGRPIPTAFAGNVFSITAQTSAGVENRTFFGTSAASNHSESQALTWFQSAHPTRVIAAFSEHVPCANCSAVLHDMRTIAGCFVVHWGVNVGNEDTASNEWLSTWWHRTTIYRDP